MRAILGALAVVAPVGGVRGCGEPAAGPVEVRLDVSPPTGDLRYACFRGDSDRQFHDPARGAEVRERVHLDAPCTLHVYRKDGVLWRRSDAIEVPAGAGAIEVELPSEPIAGIGITFQATAEGAVVRSTVPFTPADGVLDVGDVIVRVDGVVVQDASPWGFRDWLQGEAFTPVVLEVRGREGEVRTELLGRMPIGTDPDEVRRRALRELKEQGGRLADCYNARLRELGDFDATFRVELKIGVDGRVADMAMRATDGRHDPLFERCLEAAIHELRFSRVPEPIFLDQPFKFWKP